MKANVSISRVHSSHRDDFIAISIVDEASGLIIWQGDMSLEDFAKTITGQGGLKAETERIASKWSIGVMGCKRICRTVQVANIKGKAEKDSVTIAQETWEQYQELFRDGWVIDQDGSGRQQPHPTLWNVILVKYEDFVEEENDTN
jgi:hypothetical protein